MTSLLEGARPFVTRGTDLGTRLDGVQGAIKAARGRLDDELLDDVSDVTGRATGRLRLSAEHTVVAIAGATGSGKSSTFNALTGLDLSSTGVRRPTTSWATACVWGSAGAEEVLDWLGIPPRHQTMRDSLLDLDHDSMRADRELDGVVLLDLPDHDSTEVAHHLEVDRLVELADLLVWVLDPQKYADAAIHDRYLAPLKGHSGIMVVVLNHIDTVPEDRRQSMIDDVRRLLDLDGLHDVPVYGISAREQIGVDELRGEVAERVSAKRLTRERIEADLRGAASRIAEASGHGKPRELTPRQVRDLENNVAEAAGVPSVVEAVERSTRRRATRATTWPVLAAFSGLGPDPVKRLGLDLGDDAAELSGRSRAARPAAPSGQRSRIDAEVRRLAEEASAGLGEPWAESVRGAVAVRLPEVGDRLDGALASTDLGDSRLPPSVQALRVVQWLLLLVALIGAGWTAVLAVQGRLSEESVQVVGVAIPLLMLVGGVVLGLLLAVLARPVAKKTAAARAHEVDERLRGAVRSVTGELVISPLTTELDAHATMSRALAAAMA